MPPQETLDNCADPTYVSVGSADPAYVFVGSADPTYMGMQTRMTEKSPYSINTEVRFGPLELIDIPALVAACKEPWFNQTLCRVNDCVVRLGIIRGEFHWHKHDREDEFFYVVDGQLFIDLEERTVELSPKQGFSIQKGFMHRTRAPKGAVILMVEGAGVIPTGD